MTNDFSGRMDEASSSPTAKTWLMDAGLDANDRQLVQSVETYYIQHKAAPSVEWARRRNNELEEERTNKDLETQLPQVEEWLSESAYWRRSARSACSGRTMQICCAARRSGTGCVLWTP
jgi:hypothetical protein